MNNYSSKRNGFSIVEICIACVIFMTLLIPIVTIMSKGNSGAIHNKNEFSAKQLAANIIAYCNLIPFNSPEISEGENIIDKLKLNFNENDLIKINGNKIINIAAVDESFLKLIKVLFKGILILSILKILINTYFKIYMNGLEKLENVKWKNLMSFVYTQI